MHKSHVKKIDRDIQSFFALLLFHANHQAAANDKVPFFLTQVVKLLSLLLQLQDTKS